MISLDEGSSRIEEKRELVKPYMHNNLAALTDFLLWLFKQNLDLVEEAVEDRRRIIELLEGIAEGMDEVSQPRLIVVVHEEKSMNELASESIVEPMVTEELDSGFWSRIKRALKA